MMILFLLFVIGIVVRFRGINLDATNHCSLKCPGCARQRFVDGLNGFEDIVGPVPGRPITLEEMDKITDYFEEISFCGTISDPTLHPKFHDLLQMCVDKDVETIVHVAATIRPSKWFTKAFNISKGYNVRWVFGIDGKPEDSHKYRIGQDGKFLYNMMIRAAAMGIKTTWNYVVFNYNENDTESCRLDAESRGIEFDKIISCRWWTDELQLLKPSKDYVDEKETGIRQSVRENDSYELCG